MIARKTGGRSGFVAWLTATAALVVAGVAVPYGVLGGGEPGLLVTGFWLGFGLTVIAVILVGMRGWRD